MSLTEYFLHIGVAGAAGELHEIQRLAAADPELTEIQRQQVAEAVGRRFSQPNAAALPVAAPRWG